MSKLLKRVSSSLLLRKNKVKKKDKKRSADTNNTAAREGRHRLESKRKDRSGSSVECAVRDAPQDGGCINSVLSDDMLLTLFNRGGITIRDLKSVSLVSRKWHRVVTTEFMREQLTRGLVTSFGSGNTGALGHGDTAIQMSPRVVEHLTRLRQRVTGIAAGEFHSVVCTDDGKVWLCGDMFLASDAHCPDAAATLPRHVSIPGFVIKVAAGSNHCLALTREGHVFSWGEGKCGQLGHGNTAGQHKPERIGGLAGHAVVDVAAGVRHSVVVTDRGQVLAWGEGSWGKLGQGDDLGSKYAPALITKGVPTDIVAASAGLHHTLLLGRDGVVYSFGSGSNGQLGHGDTNGEKVARPIDMKGAKVRAISAGGDHSLLLTAAHEVYSFGNCLFGELGLGGWEEVWEPTKVGGELSGKQAVSISSGYSHSLVVTRDGKVYSFGQGEHGQLGYGEKVNGQTEPRAVTDLGPLRPSAVAAGWKHSLMLVNPLAKA